MKFSLLATIFALLAALPNITLASDEAPSQHALHVISFYADSCGACKILEPRLKEVMKNIDKDKVHPLQFNFSNKDAIEKTKTLAADYNLQNILQKYGAKTGFIILADYNGNIIDEVTINDDTKDIAVKISSAIEKAS